MRGDILARGKIGTSAQFPAGDKKVSQMRWDYATMSDEEFQQIHHMTKAEAEKLLN